jgi:RloB-like protein
MARRGDDRPIKRRGPSREPRIRILVVCEGRRTEPLYLRRFQHHVRNPRLHVEAIGPAGVPLSVVEVAITRKQQAEREAERQRDENLRWDQVWAVFDIDQHPNVAEARQLASEHAISLAVSNPCFELWALLHFAEHRTQIDGPRLRAELKKHLPFYDKELDFAKVHAGYGDAVQRARNLDRTAAQTDRAGGNPTTGVYLLTEVISSR